jgi:hypothetical protein
LRKGDPDAINYFNNWIIQRQRDGWPQSRFDFWFTTDGWFGKVENNPYLPMKYTSSDECWTGRLVAAGSPSTTSPTRHYPLRLTDEPETAATRR